MLFLHTGGFPALFAYEEEFAESRSLTTCASRVRDAREPAGVLRPLRVPRLHAGLARRRRTWPGAAATRAPARVAHPHAGGDRAARHAARPHRARVPPPRVQRRQPGAGRCRPRAPARRPGPRSSTRRRVRLRAGLVTRVFFRDPNGFKLEWVHSPGPPSPDRPPCLQPGDADRRVPRTPEMRRRLRRGLGASARLSRSQATLATGWCFTARCGRTWISASSASRACAFAPGVGQGPLRPGVPRSRDELCTRPCASTATPDIEGGVLLVDPATVPDGEDERFLAGWDGAQQVLDEQRGISGRACTGARAGRVPLRRHRTLVEPADVRAGAAASRLPAGHAPRPGGALPDRARLTRQVPAAPLSDLYESICVRAVRRNEHDAVRAGLPQGRERLRSRLGVARQRELGHRRIGGQEDLRARLPPHGARRPGPGRSPRRRRRSRSTRRPSRDAGPAGPRQLGRPRCARAPSARRRSRTADRAPSRPRPARRARAPSVPGRQPTPAAPRAAGDRAPRRAGGRSGPRPRPSRPRAAREPPRPPPRAA